MADFAPTDTYVARQPIFGTRREVIAYELLFRSGPENFFSAKDADLASASVINNSLNVFGLDSLIGRGKKVFINTTRKVLLDDTVRILPKEMTVIELLETIDPEPDVIRACKLLKQAGYVIALDDFVFRPGYEALVELADIVKVDFLHTRGQQRREVVEKFSRYGVKFLAEKVESNDDYAEAVDDGYVYFQGYFFCKPEMIAAKDIPGFKLNYVRLLSALNAPALDFNRLEAVIKQDVSLSVKLLRYLNSAAFGWSRKIDSIKHALTLVGETTVKKWATLLAVTSLGNDKPAELVVTSLVRARFCELLGPHLGVKRDLDLFFTGMLSVVDVMMGRPVGEILEKLSVASDVSEALTTGSGPLGNVYRLARAYEVGDWAQLAALSNALGVRGDVIPAAYMEALSWADQVFDTGLDASPK
jgi:EAL and modified HD-GYP domain-containing signal transduction protein